MFNELLLNIKSNYKQIKKYEVLPLLSLHNGIKHLETCCFRENDISFRVATVASLHHTTDFSYTSTPHSDLLLIKTVA